MRYLYAEFGKKERNYTPEDFKRAAERMAGSSLDDFFSRYVAGRDELDYDSAFSAVGLELITAGATASAGPSAEKAYLGADLNQDGDRLTVRRVLSGTPAYDQGLNAGDQIVALDRMRVTRESFDARLAEKKPNDTVRLTVFRLDDLRDLDIKLGGRVDAKYRIGPVAEPSADQERLYQGWLGAPLSKPKVDGE